jgi:hypothetical protein
LREIDNALEENEPVTTNRDQFKPRLLMRQFIRMLNPPYKIKMKTVSPMYPDELHSENPEKQIGRLAETNQSLVEKIGEWKTKNLDLDHIKGKNPVIKWISMTLTDFILVLEAHQRRHFWQIEQTLLKLSGQKN